MSHLRYLTLFLLDIPDLPVDIDPEEIWTRFRNYDSYIAAHRAQFPDAAFAFASAEWHYDFRSHLCPHDSGVESLTLRESAELHAKNRGVEIEVQLRGAFNDGFIRLIYLRVHRYALTLDMQSVRPGMHREAHGDWLYDEVRLSERGLVVHEIRFASNATWLIECEDISHSWLPDMPDAPPAASLR